MIFKQAGRHYWAGAAL